MGNGYCCIEQPQENFKKKESNDSKRICNFFASNTSYKNSSKPPSSSTLESYFNFKNVKPDIKEKRIQDL